MREIVDKPEMNEQQGKLSFIFEKFEQLGSDGAGQPKISRYTQDEGQRMNGRDCHGYFAQT